MDRELHEAETAMHRKIVTPIFLALVVAIVLNLVGLLGIGWIAQNTNSTAHTIRAQTSPAAIRRTQETLNGVILQIDCNNRKALQDTIDALVERGVLRAGQLSITSHNCR